MNDNPYDGLVIDGAEIYRAGLIIRWSSPLGFGECSLISLGDGSFFIDHEFMSIEFVKTLMCKLVEKYYK